MATQSILIIDDQPEILETFEEIINMHFDIIIDTAQNAVKALDMVEKKHYSLIVCDVIMPGMNGVQFIDFLRNGDSQNKNCPIIVLSGNVTDVINELTEFPNVMAINKVDEITVLFDEMETVLEYEKSA